jgi:hypothetical protein
MWMDEILGRDVPRPGGSLLAAMAWLLLIGFVTAACYTSALLLFLTSSQYRPLCMDSTSMNTTATAATRPIHINAHNKYYNDDNDNDNDDNNNYYSKQMIEHIPNELQQWANNKHFTYMNFWPSNSVIHLTNGWAYSVVSDE